MTRPLTLTEQRLIVAAVDPTSAHYDEDIVALWRRTDLTVLAHLRQQSLGGRFVYCMELPAGQSFDDRPNYFDRFTHGETVKLFERHPDWGQTTRTTISKVLPKLLRLLCDNPDGLAKTEVLSVARDSLGRIPPPLLVLVGADIPLWIKRIDFMKSHFMRAGFLERRMRSGWKPTSSGLATFSAFLAGDQPQIEYLIRLGSSSYKVSNLELDD